MVIINGNVTGNVYSSKHVELAAKAVVEGNVHYQLIEMVKGAQVNGSLVYSGSSATQKAESSSAATNAKKDNKMAGDRKSTRLNSSHVAISYDVFCLKKK